MSDDRKPVPWRGDSFGRAMAAYDIENIRQQKRVVLLRLSLSDERAERLVEALRKQNA